jgi:hypothetical protein
LPPEERWPEDRRALERIKFDVSEWDQMNWYVTLANADMGHLSPGETLSLQEEVRSLERTLFRDILKVPLPELEEIRNLHSIIRTHLESLADKGYAVIGPFSLKVHIVRPKVPPFEHGQGWYDLVHYPDLTEGDLLAYHMSQLLQKFGHAIRRCPHCNKIFLQQRRNGRYCGRTCQSRAVMKRIRAEKKATKKPKKNKRRQRSTPLFKGR